MAIPTEALRQITGLKMPFKPSSPASAPQGGTSARPKPPPAAPPATPPPAAAPPPLPAVLPSPDENPIGSTLGLIGYQQAELAKAPATPFEGRPVPQAPRAVSKRAPTPMPAPLIPAAPAVSVPTAVPGVVVSPAIEASLPPRLGVSTPELMIGSPALSPDEIAAWPPGLGAEFLIAMAEAGVIAPS